MLVMSARTLIEKQPEYCRAAARLLLDDLRTEALSFVYNTPSNATQSEMKTQYTHYFGEYIKRAVDLELLDPRLREYDLDFLGKQLDVSRDHQFTYLGLQTLYDRYFIHSEDTRFELPQAFFMRVAMGLAINEINREQSAVEFYRLLSSFDFMSSTPTLFNSGTLRPQLSSCYLTMYLTTWTVSSVRSKTMPCSLNTPAVWAMTGHVSAAWVHISRAPMVNHRVSFHS